MATAGRVAGRPPRGRNRGSVANLVQGRESSRYVVPRSCGEQAKLLGERWLLVAGILRLLFAHHLDAVQDNACTGDGLELRL